MALKKTVKSSKKSTLKTASRGKKNELLFENSFSEDKKLGKSPAEIVHLIKYLETEKVDEFEYTDGDFSIFVKREEEPQIQSSDIYGKEQFLNLLMNAEKKSFQQPQHQAVNSDGGANAAENTPKKPETEEESKYLFVESPIAGTFYEAPSPTSASYVKSGQKIEKGQVVCIVEAMKLMNEIKSEFSGTVHKICVKNGEMVQAKQRLFYIIPE